MVVFPNCKINLGLRIVGKREDGYHNIETIFYPIPVYDALEIIPNHNNSTIQFTSSGLHISGKEQDNLCIKAYELLRKDFPQIPVVQMHLYKAIPMGAGLGGGSADAAFTLQLLNDKFSLQISQERLLHYASLLGSDCAFFLVNKPCYASGRGEILTAIDLTLSGYKILIVNPGIHIGTAWAYQQVKPNAADDSLQDIVKQSPQQWQSKLINDFEEPVLRQYPELQHLKEVFYRSGAQYVSMSGSGSTFYGIYSKETSIDISLFSAYDFVKMADL